MQILTHLKCSIKITLSERLGVFNYLFFFIQGILRHYVCLPEADKKCLQHQVRMNVKDVTSSCYSLHCCKCFVLMFLMLQFLKYWHANIQ